MPAGEDPTSLLHPYPDPPPSRGRDWTRLHPHPDPPPSRGREMIPPHPHSGPHASTGWVIPWILGLGLVLAACAPQIALPQGDAIRFGAPISLTGSQAQSGQMVDEGYQFCQDWVNGQGGSG